VKEPGHWLVEVDGVVVGEGSVANSGAQTTELVFGAGTFAGVGQYSEHAAFSVAELRVWDRALSPANLTVLSALDQAAWANAPRLDLVSPDVVQNTAATALTLDGLYFVDGAQVEVIRAGIDTLVAAPVSFVDQSRLSVTVDFSGLAGGPRDLRVINPDGQSMTLQSALTVQEPSPAILEFLAAARDGISPPSVPSNESPWLSTLGTDTLTLVNFDATASSGWQGDGSIDDPWQLRLDGNDDELLLSGPGLDDVLVSQALSAEFWVRVDESDSVGTFLRWEQQFQDFGLDLRRDGVNLFDGGVLYPMGTPTPCSCGSTRSPSVVRPDSRSAPGNPRSCWVRILTRISRSSGSRIRQ